MCTVSVIPLMPTASGGAGFRLVTSRDEQRSRVAASPPAWRHAAGDADRRMIYPTDPHGPAHTGGTWVGAAEHGLVLCLLNRKAPGDRMPEPQRTRSRGGVIPALLARPDADAAADALAAMDLTVFPPFRLLALSMGPRPGSFEARVGVWDGRCLAVEAPAGPTMCLASSGLGDALVQERVGLFDEFMALGGLEPAGQDAFHRHRWPERPERSVLMDRPDARTVSITSVGVRPCAAGGAADVQMRYEVVPPSLTPLANAGRVQTPMRTVAPAHASAPSLRGGFVLDFARAAAAS